MHDGAPWMCCQTSQKKEDGRSTEAETTVLSLTPDEVLVVDLAGGLGGCNVIQRAMSSSPV
jgi:hypothetical protein